MDILSLNCSIKVHLRSTLVLLMELFELDWKLFRLHIVLNSIYNLFYPLYFVLEILAFSQAIMSEHIFLFFDEIFRFLSFWNAFWFWLIFLLFLRWWLRGRLLVLNQISRALLRVQLVLSIVGPQRSLRFFFEVNVVGDSQGLLLGVKWLNLDDFVFLINVEFYRTQVAKSALRSLRNNII